jgi:hypothetical protein
MTHLASSYRLPYRLSGRASRRRSHGAARRSGRAPGQRPGAAALAVLLAVGVGVLLVLWPGPAAAKSQKKLAYGFEQVWPAAVRFLRVDEGVEIVEKDMDAGYVIFTVSDDGKRFRGTLEIVRTGEKEDQPGLLLLVGIEDRPAYMEQGILDRFEQKLRAELGSPRPPAPAPAPSPSGPAQPKEERPPPRP